MGLLATTQQLPRLEKLDVSKSVGMLRSKQYPVDSPRPLVQEDPQPLAEYAVMVVSIEQYRHKWAEIAD